MSSPIYFTKIKDHKDEEIKILMEEELKSIENVRTMDAMRKKALDLCKKGQISLGQKQLFFHTGVLKKPVPNLNNEKIQKDYTIIKNENKSNNEDAENSKGDGNESKRDKEFNNGDVVIEEEIKDTSDVSLITWDIKSERKLNLLLQALNTFASTTVPDGLVLKCSGLEEAEVGIFSFKEVKKDAIFGPYAGSIVYDRQNAYDNGYCWDIYINNEFHHCVDARNTKESNWMRYVNPTDSAELQNLEAFQREYQIYFRAMNDIPAGTELLVWYSLQYNQDCHLTDSNISVNCRKSLENVVTSIKKLEAERIQKADKLFNCDVGDTSFHKKSHLNVDNIVISGHNTYKCDICNKTFSNSSKITIHKRTHTGENPFVYDVCEKNFTQMNGLITHKRIHTREKPYKCEICKKAFTHMNVLKTHKRIHTGKKPFNCDVCEKTFSQMNALITHKRIHTGEKPFKCEICDKMFTTVGNLNSHKRIHTREKPYKCEICEKTFSQMNGLKTHKRIHTGEKPFKCDVCEKMFTKIVNLKTHKRIHTGEKPFKCNVCEKTFSQMNALITHKRIHTGEKPFKCEICDKIFTMVGNLTIHKRIHTQEKPYKCTMCQNSYTTSGSLRYHQQRHKSSAMSTL